MIIETFHATLNHPSAFEDGVLPLAHFGCAGVGLWQAARQLSKLVDSVEEIDEFPDGAWLLPIALRAQRPLDLPDWDTPSPSGLLAALRRIGLLSVQEHIDHISALEEIAGEHRGGKTPAGRQYVGEVVGRLGYDVVKYETVHEQRGATELAMLVPSSGEQDATCWCNMEKGQVEICGTPYFVPRASLYTAMVVHMREHPVSETKIRALLPDFPAIQSG